MAQLRWRTIYELHRTVSTAKSRDDDTWMGVSRRISRAVRSTALLREYRGIACRDIPSVIPLDETMNLLDSLTLACVALLAVGFTLIFTGPWQVVPWVLLACAVSGTLAYVVAAWEAKND